MKFGQVLVIDDSDADLLYTRIVLEAAAVAERVLPFETAIDALAFLQSPTGQAAELILLDINMPEMDGFEFLAAYQKLFGQPAQARVVMLTSSPDPRDRERALAFPFVKAYLVKPIDKASAADLVAALRA